ncbi:sphingomyelin phosphodiesterase acid-like 3 [Granulicella rosea]|uniref:Sphingomyelin phosphodiesterase acid-like 3 n=1 Tax=Granulicella rosea TaxID=474952 RepID=A0A239GXE8_9BACT|nr:sphingomyelin phosphodiesterase acid-like 3 [Granulicella rosea]
MILLCCSMLFLSDAIGLSAQMASPRNQAAVNAVLLSDVHLDPFLDPSKVERLQASPIGQWDAILSEPNAPDAAERNAAVQKACGARGLDSSYALMTSTLAAAKAQAAGARFVMVGGDMLVHQFDCHFKTILPGKTAADEAEFAARTANFVMASIDKTFPGIPIYSALGNNDVGCGNTKLNVRDPFLTGTVDAVLHGLRGARPAELRQARLDYTEAGYYTLRMGGAMRGTRLIVIDDTYLLEKHYDCTGAKEFKGGEEQLAFLTRELDRAKRRGEHVWVLGHAAPGVNTFDTFSKLKNMCTDGQLTQFLRDDSLAKVMQRYPAQIRLGLFAHSHMDELRLLPAAGGGVPVKILSSISPVNGNLPAFVTAKVNPRTATLVDYTLYTGSNVTGAAEDWTRAYRFGESFHEPDFSARSLAELVGRLQADPAAESPESQALVKFYGPGITPSPLETIWPAFACLVNHYDEAGFKACFCKAEKP